MVLGGVGFGMPHPISSSRWEKPMQSRFRAGWKYLTTHTHHMQSRFGIGCKYFTSTSNY